MSVVLPKPGLLVGSDRIDESSGGRHLHIYPGTGRATGEVVLAGPREIDLAVRAARDAFLVWQGIPANERRNTLLRLADLVIAHGEELADLQTLEIGVPRQLATQMPAIAAEYLRYNAGWLDKIGGDVVTTWPARSLDYTLDEPYGVVALIIPWNGVLVSMGQMLGPVLAAGNAVVVKPPELAPYVASRVGELCQEAGMPPGLVNVLPGDASAGEALVRHPGIDKVHFTGSGATARSVLAAAAENLTPVGLELGGKSPHLVFADADLRLAARLAMMGAVALAGQGCANGTRVLVEAAAYDQVLEILTARLKRIPVGDPFSDRTVIGPVVSATACDRIMTVIADARDSGAGRLVLGGERLGGDLADGYFIAPTVFADVDHGSDLAQREIFGPVLAVLKFTGDDEAVRLADDTTYGLGAYVHTNNLRRAHRVSRAVAAGSVWVNGVPGLLAPAPFGGVKQSGFGRTGGLAGVHEFLRPKNVWIAM
jgi:acyl-CoA reductase-like NAD-dependent aldehyde dehydrogenase